MATGDALHKSVWLEAGLIETSPLRADAACEVCIVGGGIAGLLTAERLSDMGVNVMVLDAAALCSGETGRTTAHFVTALDDRYTHLEAVHGKEGARLTEQSHAAGINHVEERIAKLGIQCEWRRVDGYLTVQETHRAKVEQLLSEEAAAAHRAGAGVERVASLPSPWPAGLGPALRFPHQAQVHPVKMLNGMVKHLLARGVKIHTGTRVKHVHGGETAAVETEVGPTVKCGHVVVATNTPINNLVAVHTKQSGYQTYVVAFRVAAGALPPLLHWDGLWEDDVSYHYTRLLSAQAAGGDDLLIIGGEDHKTGQAPEGKHPYQCIEDWTRALYPMAGVVDRVWSGEVMEPADGMAYIGHNAVGRKNVYIVTGDSGNGMTHGAIAALLIPELIMGREHPWAKLYDPARKIGMHALGDYARENLNTLAQYRDWLKGGDVKDEGEIKPGEGAVICRGLKHIAVYKNAEGVCTRHNAACPHLGAVVRWNREAKTWDCPAHGSRFGCDGKVMHGPANGDLRPYQEK